MTLKRQTSDLAATGDEINRWHRKLFRIKPSNHLFYQYYKVHYSLNLPGDLSDSEMAFIWTSKKKLEMFHKDLFSIIRAWCALGRHSQRLQIPLYVKYQPKKKIWPWVWVNLAYQRADDAQMTLVRPRNLWKDSARAPCVNEAHIFWGKFCLGFSKLTHFQNFEQFPKFCHIFKILSYFQYDSDSV